MYVYEGQVKPCERTRKLKLICAKKKQSMLFAKDLSFNEIKEGYQINANGRMKKKPNIIFDENMKNINKSWLIKKSTAMQFTQLGKYFHCLVAKRIVQKDKFDY